LSRTGWSRPRVDGRHEDRRFVADREILLPLVLIAIGLLISIEGGAYGL
jgi:hypothetical protein